MKKIVVSAIALVAFIAPAAADAAVNLKVINGPNWSKWGSGSYDYYYTSVTFEAPSNWRVGTDCTSTNLAVSDTNYNPISTWPEIFVNEVTDDLTGEVIKNQVNITYRYSVPRYTTPEFPVYINYAEVSCNAMNGTKNVVTYPLRWRDFTKTRGGNNTSSRSYTNSYRNRCYINSTSYAGLHLDCWGGSYAQATYRFNLPSDARRINRTIRTTPGCCSSLGGSTSKRWMGNTAIVRVTGWHGIYIKKVKISYQHRVRTRVVTKVPIQDTGFGQFGQF